MLSEFIATCFSRRFCLTDEEGLTIKIVSDAMQRPEEFSTLFVSRLCPHIAVFIK